MFWTRKLKLFYLKNQLTQIDFILWVENFKNYTFNKYISAGNWKKSNKPSIEVLPREVTETGTLNILRVSFEFKMKKKNTTGWDVDFRCGLDLVTELTIRRNEFEFLSTILQSTDCNRDVMI